jgi:hypothetical protein
MTPRTLLGTALALAVALAPAHAQHRANRPPRDAAPVDWRAPDAGRDGETAAGPSYYLLNVGDTWTYSLGGNKFVLTVVRHEQFAGVTCARIEMQLDGRVMSFEHVAVRDGGVYRYGFEGQQADPPVRFLPLPPRPGEEWKLDSKLGKETITGTMKAGGEETVTVPAGTFRAVPVVGKLKANGMDVESTTHFARGVGMVRQKIQLGGQAVTIELEKFQPAKPTGGGR